jgi:hypothetical protein
MLPGECSTYGLDLKCLFTCWRVGLQPMQLLGGGGNFRSWSLVEGNSVVWWMPLKDVLRIWPLLLFFAFLGCHDVSRIPLPPTLLPWCLALPQAQSSRNKWPWTETSETVSQNKLFLLKSCLSQVFCHCEGKVS